MRYDYTTRDAMDLRDGYSVAIFPFLEDYGMEHGTWGTTEYDDEGVANDFSSFHSAQSHHSLRCPPFWQGSSSENMTLMSPRLAWAPSS